MKLWIPVLIMPLLIGLSTVAFSYPPSWENFDPNSLDGARDETIGNTQQMLAERGSVECIACHGETDDHYDGVITTSEIVSGTMSAASSCLDWEVRGICVWLTCIGPACEVDYSVKVKNFVPELTIQSYDRANGEPWTESQDINQVSQGDADSSWVTTIISWIEDYNVEDVGIRGGVSTEGKKNQHANLFFKLVDAYGNPAISAFNELASSTGDYVCEGTTTMYFPYFISNLDSIAWRWDVPEMFYPQSWLPLVQEWDLGNGSVGAWGFQMKSNNYGAIYPRHGFMISQDPLKAAVLSAFRAAHFITRSNEPHLYFTIDEDDEPGYWPPEPLDQDDENTGQWQMLYPLKEESCRSFPYSSNESTSRRSIDGSYVWNFWRAFKCCAQEGAVLIFHSG
ncbi:MAG: TIGR03756 family integrating conjugative element protein [Pseudomonadales bacterium]|nr:TIGR03756 family integrating conjugative element protein [Pseudomonadales bacterium]